MNTKSIATKIIAGTMALSQTACKREPIHQITNVTKYPIIERVDSFAKSALNKVDTTLTERIKVDTLEISNKKLNDKNKLVEYLDKNARRSNSEVLVDTRPVYSFGMRYDGKMGYRLRMENFYEPKYIPSEMAGVMQNKVYTNKSEDKFFVPVTYYGIRNPKAEK